MLRAANTQIAKSNLFGEFGSPAFESTITKSVRGQAEEVRKAHPGWTIEQAEAHILMTNPDLGNQILNEEG